MTVGAMIMSIGLIAMSMSTSVPFFIASWMLLGIGGAGALSTAAQIAMAEIFGERARQAIGAMSLVSGLSNTFLWPITSRIDQAYGWRATVALYACALIIVYVPLIQIFASKHRGTVVSQAADRPTDNGQLDPIRFALVAAATALNGFITWGFSLTLIPLLMQKGLDNGQAVALGSALGLVQIAARLFDVVGNWSPLRSAFVSTITMLFSFVLLYLGGSMAVAVAFVVLYGMAGGLMAVVRATLPLTMFPPQAYARAAARLALPLNLSFAAAPPVFARTLEGPGSQAALILTTSLCAVSLVCLILLARLVSSQERAATT